MTACAPNLGMVLKEFVRPARHVEGVFLHHSAVSIPTYSAENIHLAHLANGWSCIGYHFFIKTDGVIELGRDIERVPAATAGHNTGSIAICMNGKELDDFTVAQQMALFALCTAINEAYGGEVSFHGHKEVAATLCPAYNYKHILNLDSDGFMMKVAPPEPDILPEMVSFNLRRPVLSKGSRNGNVIIAQRLLPMVTTQMVVADGIFGPKTHMAVEQAQELAGLPVTGVIDLDTWLLLEQVGT